MYLNAAYHRAIFFPINALIIFQTLLMTTAAVCYTVVAIEGGSPSVLFSTLWCNPRRIVGLSFSFLWLLIVPSVIPMNMCIRYSRSCPNMYMIIVLAAIAEAKRREHHAARLLAFSEGIQISKLTEVRSPAINKA